MKLLRRNGTIWSVTVIASIVLTVVVMILIGMPDVFLSSEPEVEVVLSNSSSSAQADLAETSGSPLSTISPAPSGEECSRLLETYRELEGEYNNLNDEYHELTAKLTAERSQSSPDAATLASLQQEGAVLEFQLAHIGQLLLENYLELAGLQKSNMYAYRSPCESLPVLSEDLQLPVTTVPPENPSTADCSRWSGRLEDVQERSDRIKSQMQSLSKEVEQANSELAGLEASETRDENLIIEKEMAISQMAAQGDHLLLLSEGLEDLRGLLTILLTNCSNLLATPNSTGSPSNSSSPVPSPSVTLTPTPVPSSALPSYSSIPTTQSTVTFTPTPYFSPTLSPTPGSSQPLVSPSFSPSAAATTTASPIWTPTPTPSSTSYLPGPSWSASTTPSPTITPKPTAVPSFTGSQTPTPTPSITSTPNQTPSPVSTGAVQTLTPFPSYATTTPVFNYTPTPYPSPTSSSAVIAIPTANETATPIITQGVAGTPTPAPSGVFSPSATPVGSPSATITTSATPTPTSTPTPVICTPTPVPDYKMCDEYEVQFDDNAPLGDGEFITKTETRCDHVSRSPSCRTVRRCIRRQRRIGGTYLNPGQRPVAEVSAPCQTCTSAKVVCDSAAVGENCGVGAGGCAKIRDCTMFLSEQACQAAGISTGTHSVTDLKAIDCSKIDISTDKTIYQQLNGCCAAVHEATHLGDKNICDIKNEAGLACIEKTAEQVERSCMRNASERICLNGPIQACHSACYSSAVRHWSSQFDFCMCDKSKEDTNSCIPTLDTDDCTACYEKCLDYSPLTIMAALGPRCQTVLTGEPLHPWGPDPASDRESFLHAVCYPSLNPATAHSCKLYVPEYVQSAPDFSPAPAPTPTN